MNRPICFYNGLIFFIDIYQDVAWDFNEVIECADHFMNFFIGALLY
ncbi:hypothetical protein NIPOLPBK_00923 [Stenotrophomonas maltophilia]|nr:hypothetical protein NIPOLPBK_00923 [Stenotrophomonas maltophilia]WBL68878.1 hypothetical protein SMAL454_27210 [Stenotrophomonas maltophilia]